MRPAGARRSLAFLGVLLLALLWAGAGDAATRLDPALRFRRLRTTHFEIYFHQGEDALAAHLADVAEEAWASLRSAFALEPPRRTHVILVDQSDLSNGWATPLPYDTILLHASWPDASETIGNTRDWLRVVLTHELTHIVHLDQSRGYARLVKRVFGRSGLAFPNLFEPTWEVEGLATYFESALTGEGRRSALDFRAVEREPARAGFEFPMSRANGGLIAWPAGLAPYAYGLGFEEYLAGTYGQERLAALGTRTAGRLPYTGARAYRHVFGLPLGHLWDDYQRQLRQATQGRGGTSAGRAPTRLTTGGFVALGPRIVPGVCTGCPDEVVYSARNPHEFPALKSVPLTGGPTRTLTRRYQGSTVAVGRGRLLFDQQERGRNVGLYSDVYELDRASTQVRRLTEGRRLRDPDLSPDGRTLAAVQESRGARALVLATLDATGAPGATRPLLDGPNAQYATPRWSPDGRSLIVERHLLGSAAEIVLVDVETKAVRVVARGATRATTPAWRPDGEAIVAAVDVPGEPFNLVEFPLAGGAARRLTDMPGGATWPAITPDGRTLIFVGYTSDGFDLFSQPYDWTSPIGPASGAGPGPGDEPAPGRDVGIPVPVAGASRYSPWPTLLPRAWTPLLYSDGDQVQAGVAATGTDVLTYHAIAGAVLWRATAPAAARTSASEPDWRVTYAYDRWRPTWFTSVSRATSFLRGASASDDGVTTLREDTLEAGMFLPFRRVQRTQRLLLAGRRATNTFTGADGERRLPRVAARIGWSISTAQQYGYSISAVDGVSIGVTAEVVGRDPARLLDAATYTADARAYVRGFGRHHVFAVRAAGGLSEGGRDFGRIFRLGGGSSNGETLDFGRGAISLLRGFGSDTFAGRRVALANVEYRAPLARIERGAGTWPIFLRTLHGAVFADVGHAWSLDFRARDLKTAVGAELSGDVVLGYAWPVTFTVGAARGRDGAGRVPSTNTVFARVGRAF